MLLYVLSFVACGSPSTTGAKLRYEEGNHELAIQLAKKGIAQNPNDASAYFVLGLSYSSLDSVALAYESFLKAVELGPDDEDTKLNAENNIRHNFAKHYNRGQHAYNTGAYREAAAEFEAATQADPREPTGFYNLGVAYSRLAGEGGGAGDNEKALGALEHALAMFGAGDEHFVDALELSGRVLVSMGRPEEAVDTFRRLANESPASYVAIERAASELMEREEWQQAAVMLEVAAEARAHVGAEDFDLHYNIGTLWYRTREADPGAARRTVEHYKKALALRPGDFQTVLNLMVANAWLEDWPEAILWGERYVQTQPEDATGWRLLARCYTEAGDKEKAKECLLRVERAQATETVGGGR
jgi:tetratricopeptide (TPR) repeat protein